MKISGLLTSLGINMGICVLFFSIYSVLRKQPSNKRVYFARTLAHRRSKRHDPHWFDRFVPSPRWILQSWQATEGEIMKIGGLDAVIFVKALVFSIRIFSIASIICLFLVLPLNYFGRDVQHKRINAESLEVFTIQNVKEGSKWLWAHCLALYIICCSACILLYLEYKSVSKLRMTHLRESIHKTSHFTVLFRGIPWASEGNYSSSLEHFLTKYYPTSYKSHEMVYRCGKIVKLMKKAEKMYDLFVINNHPTQCAPCKSCVGWQDSLQPEETNEKTEFNCDSQESPVNGKECGAAFVFFKSRYDAATIAQARQSSNPMLWVTNLAPEPSDVYWSNLCVPYKQFWMRKIGTFMATTAFMIFFLIPVTLVQGLANLDDFERTFPFLRGILNKPAVGQVVTGYLPSVILILFLCMVPPLMILFSTIEGSISRSGRKKAACIKVLYFYIWNVFFVNLVSGTLVKQVYFLSNPRDIPKQLATNAVPALINFFMTYVMTSGWTSLAIELIQLYPLLVNSIYKFILRKKVSPFGAGFTFPFHTEFPRVLLFGVLGFNFAILAPLILPLLLIYFCLAYVIYRNQILNVYLLEYDTGGQYWPIFHNTTIFSMVLAQIMALGVFVIKASPVCIGFTIILIIGTLLFNEYCRQRFLPIFKDISALELIEMDQQDEATGREEIYKRFKSTYSQRDWVSYSNSGICRHSEHLKPGDESCSSEDAEAIDLEPGVTEAKRPEAVPIGGQPRSPVANGSGARSPVTHNHGGAASLEGKPETHRYDSGGRSPVTESYGGGATLEGKSETHGGAATVEEKPETHGYGSTGSGGRSPVKYGYGGASCVEGKPETHSYGSGGRSPVKYGNGGASSVEGKPATHGYGSGGRSPARYSNGGAASVVGKPETHGSGAGEPVGSSAELSDQPRSPVIDRKEEVKPVGENRKQPAGEEGAEFVEGTQPQSGTETVEQSI